MLNDYMILALKGKCQYSWTRYSYRHDTLPTNYKVCQGC